MTDILELVKSGLSVIPIQENKEPAIPWMDYKSKRPTLKETEKWLKSYRNFAIVCGKISGNLTCIDIDLKYDIAGNLLEMYTGMIKDKDPALLDKMVIQKTINNGYHMFYRCSEVSGNQKLASRQTQINERKDENDKVRVLIETRGEGGYVLCEPSPGYIVVRGDLSNISNITIEEQAVIIGCAKKLNQVSLCDHGEKGVTPLDAYDESVSNDEVVGMLVEAGWKIIKESSGVYYFARPGKDSGISATYNHIPNRLWVFSTSTQFESEKTYRPAAIYTELIHGGDYKSAARQLSKDGFGTPKQKTSGIISLINFEKDIDNMYTSGMPEGFKTGIGMLDSFYRVHKGFLNVVTGIPTHGKSEIMDSIVVSLAKRYSWKFLIYSPENYPFEVHFMKIAQKYLNKPMFGRGCMDRGDLERAKKWFDNHIIFVDGMTRDDIDLDFIISGAEEYMTHGIIDGVLIDPWNELEAYRPSSMSETEYIGDSLKKLRKFCRRKNVATWLVAHPTKQTKDMNTGMFSMPTLYSINGSAHWYNKADNGIVVYRENDITTLSIQKVKQSYMGKKGEVKLCFDKYTGNYFDGDTPVDEYDF